MVKIKSIDGVVKEVDCIGCAIQRLEIKRIGGVVAETEHFEVTQDIETPIPGFMILSSKAHLKGIGDFSKELRAEYIEFLYKIRKAMKTALGVDYTDLIQDEDSIKTISHFHMWLFPRYPWMDRFGSGIVSILPIIKYARENMKMPANLKKVAMAGKKLKEFLAK